MTDEREARIEAMAAEFRSKGITAPEPSTLEWMRLVVQKAHAEGRLIGHTPVDHDRTTPDRFVGCALGQIGHADPVRMKADSFMFMPMAIPRSVRAQITYANNSMAAEIFGPVTDPQPIFDVIDAWGRV